MPLSGFIHRPAGTLNMKGYWIIATHCPGLTLEQSYFPRLICLVERKIALEKCETVQTHAKKARKTLSVSPIFSAVPLNRIVGSTNFLIPPAGQYPLSSMVSLGPCP